MLFDVLFANNRIASTGEAVFLRMAYNTLFEPNNQLILQNIVCFDNYVEPSSRVEVLREKLLFVMQLVKVASADIKNVLFENHLDLGLLSAKNVLDLFVQNLTAKRPEYERDQSPVLNLLLKTKRLLQQTQQVPKTLQDMQGRVLWAERKESVNAESFGLLDIFLLFYLLISLSLYMDSYLPFFFNSGAKQQIYS